MISLLLLWMFHVDHFHAAPVQTRHEVCPGATYFYEKHHPKPDWARKMTVVCVIQNHIFLKEHSSKK